MWKQLKQWYMDTLLPYENPNHPLHTSNCQDERWKADAEALGYGQMCGTPKPLSKRQQRKQQERANTQAGMVGPNYARPMGAKPREYVQWGNKWYRKG